MVSKKKRQTPGVKLLEEESVCGVLAVDEVSIVPIVNAPNCVSLEEKASSASTSATASQQPNPFVPLHARHVNSTAAEPTIDTVLGFHFIDLHCGQLPRSENMPFLICKERESGRTALSLHASTNAPARLVIRSRISSSSVFPHPRQLRIPEYRSHNIAPP